MNFHTGMILVEFMDHVIFIYKTQIQCWSLNHAIDNSIKPEEHNGLYHSISHSQQTHAELPWVGMRTRPLRAGPKGGEDFVYF